jgi:hypothetical protein
MKSQLHRKTGLEKKNDTSNWRRDRFSHFGDHVPYKLSTYSQQIKNWTVLKKISQICLITNTPSLPQAFSHSMIQHTHHLYQMILFFHLQIHNFILILHFLISHKHSHTPGITEVKQHCNPWSIYSNQNVSQQMKKVYFSLALTYPLIKKIVLMHSFDSSGNSSRISSIRREMAYSETVNF